MKEFEKVMEAVKFIESKVDIKPEIGIILGTGLSGLGEKIENKVIIPYKEIPHFPLSTVETHLGNLVFGKIGNKNVMAMQGRFHLYEGYSPSQVVFPIRVMKFLGINILIESNAAGGLNPLFNKGDLVLIVDHINLTGQNPLVGENDERFGPRFPDMSSPYSPDLIKVTEDVAIEEKIPLKKGVLVGLLGPNLETKAEYRFLKSIGADMVCMSTVIEVIAGVHLGLKILGISVITDMCLPDALKPVSFEEIVEVANSAEPRLTKIIEKVIIKL
ncbi:MAG: purine-nucleoside phosphorylase [bacterium]|nr:purine-nucleoside phosphorylase [bacterium]MDW8164718.1 purine-nucleoside phosphorylase [Candidatus Omnitrophota bacterium]